MPNRSISSRALPLGRALRLAYAASLVASALAVSPAALADGPAPAAVPGQKPPCVPASSYVLGYDCELFPLPTLPAGAAPPVAAGAPVVVVAGAAAATGAPTVAAVVPAPAVAVVVPVVVVPPVPSETSSSSSHAPAYVAFAAGVGGVGMTVAFGILALQAKSTLTKDCSNGGCPASDSSTVSNLRLYDNMADIGLGVAAAGFITGTILYLTERSSSSSSAAGTRHVEPWVGLGSGGVRGSF